jgi:superfamily I DNA/RNA helicase
LGDKNWKIMTESEITQALLMKEILGEIKELKSSMPNSEIKVIQSGMDDIRREQREMKDDISDIKKKLLDPNDGVIVKVNKNTDFRLQEEDRYDEYVKFNVDMKELKTWRNGVNRALWIIFGALIAVVVKLVFGGV